MPRPIRAKLKFDEESVNKLLQEIYVDTQNNKSKTTRLYTKWEGKIKETGEFAAIGDQIIKIIAAEQKNQDQKIMLLKYLKEVVFDKIASSKVPEAKENEVVTSDRRNHLLDMVQKEVEKKEMERNKK